MAVTRGQVANGSATLFSINSPQKKKIQKSKPKPKANSGPQLNKKNGKIVRTGRQAIPTRPNTGLPKRRFPPVGSPTSKGLFNTSNDCYKLAALQALFHTPAFYRYLGKVHKDCASQLNRCVMCALQDLLYQYWEEDDSKVRRARLNTLYAATKVRANLPTLAPDLGDDFLGNRQADSYDFLNYLVTEQIGSKTPSTSFRSIFQMEFESTRTCLTCRTESVRQFDQASFILELPVNNPNGARGIWLHQCLRDFLNDGVQDWNCEEEGCDGLKRDVTTLLTHASEILVLKLAISTNAGQGGNNTKISARQTEIIYPEILNMNQYVDHHQVREDCVYRLDAVVAHSGRSTDSGHYVAMVREYNNLRDFALITDEDVTEDLDWADMLRPTLRGKRIESYILVYSKM